MDGLTLVFLLAVVVEKVVEVFKDIVYAIPFLPDKFKPLTLEILSLTCGLILAFQCNLDALRLLDVQIPNSMIGVGITGLVIGKGANFAHDFFHTFGKDQKRGVV
jgi:hypothetical protein